MCITQPQRHRLVASCQFYRLVVTCQQVTTNLSISSSRKKSVKIRLVATCHLQTCYNLSKQIALSLWITSFENQLASSVLTTCNRLVVNKLSQAIRTHPDIGLLITILVQDVDRLFVTLRVFGRAVKAILKHREYAEGSLSKKSVTRVLLRITAARSCQGANISVHLLESKSQQVHRGIHPPPPNNFKMTGGSANPFLIGGGVSDILPIVL